MIKLPKWRYVDDGRDSLCIYQCLSCRGRFNTDRLHDWLYCPRCGVPWEGEHACRHHAVPRWAWDRFGPHAPWDLVCSKTMRATAEWVIQCRTKWGDEPWSEWAIDTYSPTVDVSDGSWIDVRSYLDMCRSQHESGGSTRYEYRAKIRRKVSKS